MGNGENTKLYKKKIGGFECKVLEIICKEIKTKRDHITSSSFGNRSRPHGSGDQTPSLLLLELYDPRNTLCVFLSKVPINHFLR